jgi:hypothetical protein
MQFLQVPPSHIDRAWKDGAHNLERACDRSAGEVTGSQLKMMLARGEMSLLMLERDGEAIAWLAVRWDDMPNLRALYIYAIYAPGAAFAESFELLREYAAVNGASRIRGACGEAVARLWTRKFGFSEAYRIMEVEV